MLLQLLFGSIDGPMIHHRREDIPDVRLAGPATSTPAPRNLRSAAILAGSAAGSEADHASAERVSSAFSFEVAFLDGLRIARVFILTASSLSELFARVSGSFLQARLFGHRSRRFAPR